MADEQRKIIVDDDWKAEAQRERERLEQEARQRSGEPAEAGFTELLNLIMMQAMIGLGMVGSQTGERIPPNLEAAKHFIDLLQVLEDKTKGNLEAEEKKLLDQVMYELRMRYVQMAGGGGGGSPGSSPTPPPQGT